MNYIYFYNLITIKYKTYIFKWVGYGGNEDNNGPNSGFSKIMQHL
jgi:hypothetical protein